MVPADFRRSFRGLSQISVYLRQDRRKSAGTIYNPDGLSILPSSTHATASGSSLIAKPRYSPGTSMLNISMKVRTPSWSLTIATFSHWNKCEKPMMLSCIHAPGVRLEIFVSITSKKLSLSCTSRVCSTRCFASLKSSAVTVPLIRKPSTPGGKLCISVIMMGLMQKKNQNGFREIMVPADARRFRRRFTLKIFCEN